MGEGYNPEEDEDDTPPTVIEKSEPQRAMLHSALKHILLFRNLELEQLDQCIDAMFEVRVSKGDFVINQGDDGDNFYVIESGKFKASIGPKVVKSYDGAGSFGELALMYNVPRAASVQAETDGQLWGMDRKTFRKIVLRSAYYKRQEYEGFLESVPMLKMLEKGEQLNVADALQPKHFNAGQMIIKQGDHANGMYFIEEGECKVLRDDKEVNVLKKGDYFGELALLTHKPRAASVVAVGYVKAVFLDVEAFERLLGPCMDIMKRNVDEYEKQLIAIFGSKSAAMQDIRK